MAAKTRLQILYRTTDNADATISGLSLLAGELAFHGKTQTLYIGAANNAGTVSITAIGGDGHYVTLAGDQTSALGKPIEGDKDFTGTVSFSTDTTAVTQAAGDTSTKLATTAFVANAVSNITAEAQSINVTGDVEFSGVTGQNITNATIPDGTVTPAQLANVSQPSVIARSATGSGPLSALTLDAFTDALDLVHTDIDDFDTGVRENRLDQLAAPTSEVSFAGQRLTNLGAPTASSDAVRKSDLDQATLGIDYKPSVKAKSAGANVVLSGTRTGAPGTAGDGSPADTDGIVVAAGDRVLLTDQTDQRQNGIWVVQEGAWTRPADYDNGYVSGGALVFIEQGSLYPDTQWVITTNGPITVDVDGSSWTQFAAAALPGGTPLKPQYGGTGLGSGADGSGPAAGQLLYGGASNSTTSLATLNIGSSGAVLVSDGSAPTWRTTLDSSTLTIDCGTF